ncbi:hypothetical protein [Nostoc sp. FACHB-888]|uniref:hypothetical protein n=1 Tax=Nostoc sp. FACHB-888 TaxID=2692842 RepID=UPI0016861276|nr:hypothetical protein [Nostoc sp. FACHB-888]MBD2247032.1 hypothetical protein [Nostoc sp. FACHB-888]
MLEQISVPLLLVRGFPIPGTTQYYKLAMLVDQVSICACPCEPSDQPAAYYPSRTCWLFLVSVYTFGKTRDTFWHIHLMFYLIVKKQDARELSHH